MTTFKLTDDQAFQLRFYLQLTTSHRKAEREACERLAQERNEDGTPRFPNMARDAEWWRDEEPIIQELIEILSPPWLK